MLLNVALWAVHLLAPAIEDVPPCKDGAEECKPWERDWESQLRRGSPRPSGLGQSDQNMRLSGASLKPPIVPSPFRGEWNEDLSACGTAQNDSRLRITGTNLAFHESDGEVKRVIVHNSRAITVSATFAGEGEVWDAVQQLVLSRSGKNLTINREGSSFTRHRCP